MEASTKTSTMYPKLEQYIKSAIDDFETISKERQEKLREIGTLIRNNKAESIQSQLTFICTQNSRRSHLSQIWTATAAAYYRESVKTFSGGTEATAFNPRAVAAIERAGFVVSKDTKNAKNPHYLVRYSEGEEALECFSKKYNDSFNPQNSFIAVMTCSDADEACPIVLGAKSRVAIPYIDPKVSDNTEKEAQTYDERCKQIATEMLFLMSQVSQ